MTSPPTTTSETAPVDDRFQELHCMSCGHFLLYHSIVDGALSVKCKYCKKWNTLDVTPDALDEASGAGVESPS